MSAVKGFNGRVGIIQRLLAFYRRPFFERLAASPGISLSVLAGQPCSHEALKTADYLAGATLGTTKNLYWEGPAGLICWQTGVLSWLRQVDPQILVVEGNPRILSHWPAIWWMRRRKRPVLGWGLGELDRLGPAWLNRPRRLLAQSLVRCLDGMIAYSSKAAQDYIKAGIPASRVFVALNAIEDEESRRYLAQFGGEGHWVKPWKEALGFDPALPVVLFVGRLIPPKRVDLLIEACAPLFQTCQLLIVGDGPIRHSLEEQARPYAQRIRFVGHQTGTTLAKSFIAADIFVLPGSGGLAIHQAMSYGKPVIVSFGDGTEADLVREGINGLLVQEKNLPDLQEKIAALLADSELRQGMGRASLDLVEREMSMEAMVNSFIRALALMSHGVVEGARAI